jgi:hypothetical protein
MVAPGVVSPQDISMSPMVCKLRELDGANVHHGLGGDSPHSSAASYHAHGQRNLVSQPQPPLGKNPTWEYVK